MDEKRDLSEGFSQATEAIKKDSFITKLKHFNIISWIGIVLTIFLGFGFKNQQIRQIFN